MLAVDTAVFTGAVDGEVIATGGLTIGGFSRLPRLVTADLAVQATLAVTERLRAVGTVTVGAGHVLELGVASTNTVDGDLRVDGQLTNHGTTTVTGTLHVGPGATLDGGGVLVAAQCRSGGIVDAPPCP